MTKNKPTITLMSVLVVLLIFNQFQIVLLHNVMMSQMEESMPDDQHSNQKGKSDINLASLAKEILPTGVPAVYGAELGVSFDNAAAAINILAPYEQDTRKDKLSGEKLARYIDIGQRATCEFCCSAKTMVFPDGRKACGCAHSAAMRGVAAYLIDTTDMPDSTILAEVNRWKTAFFPGPMVQKIAVANGLIDGAVSNQGLQNQVGGC